MKQKAGRQTKRNTMNKGFLNIWIITAIAFLIVGSAGGFYYLKMSQETELKEVETEEERLAEPEKEAETLSVFPESTEEDKEPGEYEIEIKEFKTDKETYGSYEEIQISLKVFSKNEIKDVEIKIKGIQPGRYAYINEFKVVNLAEGENAVFFEAQMPYCTSGCGGVFPGPYDIYANIFVEEDLIESAITTINLISK